MTQKLDFRTTDIPTLLSYWQVKELLTLVEQHPEWPIALLVAQHPANRTSRKRKFTLEDATIVLKRLELTQKSQRKAYSQSPTYGHKPAPLPPPLDYEAIDLATLLSDERVQRLLEVATTHPHLASTQLVEKLPITATGTPLLTFAEAKVILHRLKLATIADRMQRTGREITSSTKLPLRQTIPQTLTSLGQYMTYKKEEGKQSQKQPVPAELVPPLQPVTPPVPAYTPKQQATFHSYDKFFSLTKQFTFTAIISFLFFFGGSLVFDTIFKAQTITAMTGMFFAFLSLACGMVFFLYSLKYYMSIAVVLSFSSETESGHSERKGIGRLFQSLFGISVEITTEQEQQKPARSSLSYDAVMKTILERQPFVSIHVGTYNEKRVIDRFLLAATSMEYENYEVIVADDSTDETVQLLQQWEKHPRVKISHRNTRAGYKGAALAEALKKVDPRTEFILIFDADFIPYPDVITQFLKYFQYTVGSLTPDTMHTSNIAAIQGYQWHILNKSENWITKGIRSEYSGSYVIERTGTERYLGLEQISGSVYMVRRDALTHIGWGSSITEDFELTLKLYEQGYKVVYTPYIQAPAEAVSTIKRLIRQRMRWAEGHSFNVKKMFKRLVFSPNLTFAEKFEFIYLAPYYLQAFFFIVGSLSWFTAEVIFQTRLPFWTETWGWSLVATNLFALPLMNLVGLFMEDSQERDYLGLFSFIVLSYIIAPFQAFAAVKGFLEKEEGPWFRTPKTGRITDSFVPGRFSRFIKNVFGKPAPSSVPQVPIASTALAYQPIPLHKALTRSPDFPKQPPKMRWLGKSIVVFVLTLSLLVNSLIYNVKPANAWYNNNYQYRKQITIDHTKVSGSSDLSSFPVLISTTDTNLKTSGNGGNVQNSSGYDIIFVASDDTTKLDHEIEHYVATTGEIEMWVRIPTLSHTSDTIIYMYYDNNTISSSQENVTGVWDSNYKGVWHLADNAANTTVKDSTSNANNGTNQANTSTKTATGEIDGALSFNGSSDYVNINGVSSSIGSGNVTFECWFKPAATFNTSASSDQASIGLSDSPSTNDVRLRLFKSDGKLHFTVYDGSTDQGAVSTETSWTGGTWYSAAGVFSTSSGETLYRNGVSDGTNTNTTRGSTQAAETDIGKYWNSSYFNGTLDEVRISNIARSGGWITTEYNNQSSPSTFETFGSQTQVPELTLLLFPIALAAPFLVKRFRTKRETYAVVA